MKKRLLIVFLMIIYGFSLSSVYATPTPSPGAATTCDVCGGCVGQPAPPDHEDCMECAAKDDYIWTVFGCVPTSPSGFTKTVLRIVTSIVGGLAFLSLLYGGGTILLSSGDPDKLNTGKNIIISAVVGLLLVVFAVFILQFIGVEIFDFPGFSD